MYATRHSDDTVLLKYISSHTNHDIMEVKFLPLPKDVKEGISIKLGLGIPIERILDGTVFISFAKATYQYITFCFYM